MTERKIETTEILNGGVIELWTIEGLFYVKSIVKGAVKFSECVSKWKAEYFVMDAVYYGNLEF